ncbi:hypothetical protein LQF12_10005 [Ruania suaedae]|uniref:hypothetical protein n=1 Tax=Ruania suaedae TaxID=2897774 RepID=UPI001E3FB0CB|nr:hypothetical protein [Ruania suaedae]UFU01850.1 hypothetical protein LQF12_10005 [Ruania suaedae]
MVNADMWALYEQHVSRTRLLHYLDAAAGDRGSAIELYDWSVRVSAEWWWALGHLEVALRNAIDKTLMLRHLKHGREGHWIFDHERELGRDAGKGAHRHAFPYADVAVAIERVRRNGKSVDAGQIISETSFGFWHQLVSRRQMFLWPDLANAFPGMPGRNQSLVSARVTRLRDLRNRVGHHHRIWALDLDRRLADLRDVATFIDPRLWTLLEAGSNLPELLRDRPLPSES